MKFQANDSHPVIVDKDGAQEVGAYTQADLDRARADGYNDGFRQGKQSRTSSPTTPSAAAMRAAWNAVEELKREYLLAETAPEELNEIAAIITRHLAGTTSVVRNYDEAYRRACAVLETKGLPVRVGNVVSEDNHRLAHAIAIEFAATTSPKSNDAWREWFDRIGDKASAEVVNATADLVTNERLAALTQAGVLPVPETPVGGGAPKCVKCGSADVSSTQEGVRRFCFDCKHTEYDGALKCVRCGHVKLSPWRGSCKHETSAFGKRPITYCGCKCEFPATSVAAVSGEVRLHCNQVMRYEPIVNGDVFDSQQLVGTYYCERCSVLNPIYAPVQAAGDTKCIHCDPSFVPTGPDDWCNCKCHIPESFNDH